MTQRARRDLQETSDWIASQSPQGALSWLDAFDNAREKLVTNPERFALAPESDFVPQAIREILFRTRRGENYRALFLIEAGTVLITHIRGPGQDFVNPIEFQ